MKLTITSQKFPYICRMKEKMYTQKDMLEFAEFVATFPDKNRNYKGEQLHAKSRYDDTNTTEGLLELFKKTN